jgi:small subunit ribosomal protein S2
MQDNASTSAAKDNAASVPAIKDFLKAGVQFGHETTRWNPKMKQYIFGAKNNIHIIDLEQSLPMLKTAADFLQEAAKKGPILFVATKRQAREIVKQYAVESGSYYVTYRWLGGLLTNFKMVKKSLTKLTQIEDEFEKGVTGRTKFEVNQMKKLWDRMNRIYSGIKTMDRYPEAVVVVDCHYEKGAIEEAKAAGIPVISMVDTNSDPDMIDYVIPANDDAIKSITLIMGVLTAAIKRGNPGKWVKHVSKDYSNYEVQIVKTKEVETKEDVAAPTVAVAPVHENKPRRHETKGIMELVKEQAANAAKPVETSPKAEVKTSNKKSVK